MAVSVDPPAVTRQHLAKTGWTYTFLADPEARVRRLGSQAWVARVLVGHRIQDSWWWSWGFTIVTAGLAAVALLNAAFGLAPGDSAVLWWLFGAVTVAFAFGLMYGLYQASGEQPIP